MQIASKRRMGHARKVLVGLVLLSVGWWAGQQRLQPQEGASAASAGALEDAEAGERAPGAAASPKTVVVAPVTREVAAAAVEVTGTVRPSLRADVSAKVMGRVAQVLVHEGDRVRRGDVLIRLESDDLQAAVRQAQATVRAAEEAVRQARTGVQIQDVQSSTRVVQAKAALDAARQQLSLVMEGPRRQQKLQADAAVQEAEAALSQARAHLSLVREGARRQQKLQAQQAVAQAEAQYRTAKATFERYQSLYEQEVIPRQRFDEVKAQYETAAAQYEIAKQQASLVDEGARPQEVQAAEEAVRQAEARVASARQQRDLAHEGGRTQEIAAARAQVRQAEEALRMAQAATAENRIKRDQISLLLAQQQQAEAALQAAQVQASYAVIRAPFDGVVTARLVDPGAMAAPGVPLVRLEDAGSYRLEATVPEARMSAVRVGQDVPVAVESLGWRGTGRVVEYAPSADPSSRTFIVKIGLPSLPRIASGVFGKAWLPGERQTRLLVPAAAVVRRGQLESVLIVGPDGIAHLQLVRTGQASGSRVEILSGLQAGQRVVLSRPDLIPDGTPVKVQ